MQSTDQRKVFKIPPAGIRKIILSTNIAETSVTVNDVVYVIDSGKVKEKTFDALSSVTMLKTNWISKANSIQRKGRAGRVQPGICYHLFSRIRYDNLQLYQVPEMLRLPLHELCLQTKLLAPAQVSITDFLSKAPQTPAFLIIRNAVQLLKQIDALDPWEDLTEMGHHLADLPVAPSYGKMVLYAVVLKCLDPVLTIVCSLANKDPFMLPAQPCQKRAASLSRKNFAANTFSDHMALLRAFQAWQKARTEGWEKAFCEKNFLSSASMEMIVGMRAQLLGQLRASGFVRARGGGDIRDLNVNSEKWCVVKAALCAGLYPNIIRVDRAVGQLSAAKETKVRIHNLSVLSPNPSVGSRNKNISYFPSEWIVYEEMSRNNRLASVRCCTMISPITIALFTGPAKLSPEIIKEAESNITADERKVQDFVGINVSDNNSDSGGEDSEDNKKSCLQLDEWLTFHIEPECATLALQLRQKWHSLFIRRMRAPSKPWTQVDEAIVRTVVEVLMTEERELGLQQPTGIGQRPRPMSIESIMSCSGGRNYYELEDQPEEKTKMTKRSVPSTPPKKKDSGKFRSDNALYPSGSNGNNSNHHMSGNSHSSTPCDSPQPSSPSKMAEKDPGATSSHPCRMFIMKCNSQKTLDISLNKSLWATTANNEKKLNKAFLDGKTVYMIFSVQGSGCFQGYAKMSSVISKDKGHEFPSSGICGACSIEWLKRANIPFQNTQHLSNPWNDNKKIHVSRDCQEIEPFVGECLLKLWDKPGANQKRPITRGTLDCSNVINKALYTQASNSSVSLAGGLNGTRNPAAYNRIQADIFANALANSHVVTAKGGPGAKQQSPVGHNSSMNSSSKQAGKSAHFHYRQNNHFPYQGGMSAPPPSNAGHFLGAHNIYPTAPNMIGATGMNPMYITPMMANQSPHMSNPGGLSPRHGMSPVVILQRGSNNNQNASNNNQSAGINSASSSMFTNS
ncbi:YTHDC2 [Acanthosepion pharaonis]|uniref:YTHDC2 n=1 Tax=Acanthosepion pharaonis TaxID=158019 RepID=A0A812EYG3_ACAPH|nr:YTHDC2 [Sepia pharaonis]